MTKFSLILLSFFMISCLPQFPRQEAPPVCLAEGADRAAFDVGKIKYTVVPRKESTNALLTSEFRLDFEACMQDSLKKQPMRNQIFSVHTFRDERKPEEEIKDTLCENVEWGCVSRKTFNDGCLQWSERYNFALPAEQKWIEFKRVITHRSGSRVVPMMINPWLSSEQVVDLRFADRSDYESIFNLHKAEQASNESEIQKCRKEGSLEQAFRYLDGNEDKAFLWVNKITFNPSFEGKPGDSNYKEIYHICKNAQSQGCDQEGGFLNIKLAIPVEIVFANESGWPNEQRVRNGAEFRVTLYLLSEVENSSSTNNGKKQYMLHRPIKSSQVKSTGGEIDLHNVFIHIPYETIQGDSTILLKVESLGEEQMDPFYGVYDIIGRSIGELHGNTLSVKLRSSKVEQLDMDKATDSEVKSQKQRIQEYKTEFEKFHKEDAKEAQKIYTQHKPVVGFDGFHYSKGLTLDLKRMRFARIKASGENTCSSPVKRHVVYLGEVCLKNPRAGQILAYSPVTVTAQNMRIGRNSEDRIVVELDEDEEELPIVDEELSDGTGCIQFTYNLQHKLYDIQKYFMKKLNFKTQGMQESKYIALNPWEYGFLTYQEFTQAYENWYDVHKAYNEECKNQDCSNIEDMKRAEFDLMYNECQDQNCSHLGNLFDKLQLVEDKIAGPLFSENLKPPRLRLNEYRNVIIEPSYRVEPSLDVTTVKNLQMFLQPTVVRQDSPGESIWQIPRVLPIGHYLIRFIVAKGPYETVGGKKRLLDRGAYTLNPLQGGLKLITDHLFHPIGEVLSKLSVPTDVGMQSQAFSEVENWEASARKFQQLKQTAEKARTSLVDFYLDKDYETYMENLKTPNAKGFFGDGCGKGERVPCFDKEDYITHFDTLAYAENGVLNTFVKLGFSVEHFRHLGSKNSILIEIYPTDPEHYQYKDSIETGGNKCELNITETNFKPFPTCGENQSGIENTEGCHQMKIPAHWGLFFTTEFGMLNIMWPTEQNYSEVFDLDPIEIVGKDEFKMKMEREQLKEMESVIGSVNQDQEEFMEDRINKAYKTYFDFLVNAMDQVDADRFKEYCRNKKEEVSEKKSTNLKGEDSLSEELSLALMICSENMQSSNIPRDGRELRQQIKKYFVYKDFSKAREKGIDPLQGYRNVQNQKGNFCDKRHHKATAFTGDSSDYSTESLNYQQCVCSSPNDESITRKMARCFAQEQSLAFVENSQDFLKTLKNSDGVRWSEFVAQKENVDSNLPHDFLKSLCSFWFDEYYKNYLSFENIERAYNRLSDNLESLYSNPNVHVPEENQFDVDFDHFKNISTNNASVAQWVQAVYSNKNYEPFINYKKTSNSNHPYYVCRKDPLKFFHLERKMIVGELDIHSNKTKYKNGRVYSLTTQAGQGAAARVELSARESASLGTRGEFRVGLTGAKSPAGGMFGKLLNAFNLTWGVGPSAEVSRTGTTSSSEQNTIDSAKSILLAVNHVQMDLAVKKHRSCLLIRPKINAFEKTSDTLWKHLKIFWDSSLPSNFSEDAISLMRQPYMSAGLLICNEESSEQLVIPENYYYVHQFFGGHAYEFMSRTIYHNRPYTEIIRGRDQMDKFIRLTHAITYNREIKEENPFQMNDLISHLNLDRNQLDHNLIQAFEQNALDYSGFFKGIYTYPDMINYYDSQPEKAGKWLDGRFEWIHQLLGGWEKLIDVTPQESVY